MKKNIICIVCCTILASMCLSLGLNMYMDETGRIDNDLRIIATHFVYSNVFYLRNKEILPAKEIGYDILDNVMLLRNIEPMYQKKTYPAKYKVKLIKDINEMIHNIQYKDGGNGPKGYEEAYKAIGEIGYRLQQMLANEHSRIGENEYNELQKIILEYNKYLSLISKE